MELGASLDSVDGVVQEIMKMHRSLPPRPANDDVSAAKDLIQNLEKEEQLRMESISRQRPKGQDVPQELFGVLIEMQKRRVLFQSMEHKREALQLLDLYNIHLEFDEMVQRASECVKSGGAASSDSVRYDFPKYSNDSSNLYSTGGSAASTSGVFSASGKVNRSELFTRDDSCVPKSNTKSYADGIGIGSTVGFSKPQIGDSTLKSFINVGQDGDKLSLIKLASFIEVSSKKGIKELNLQNKLLDQVDWLPDSIGKLSTLTTLDLSENRIVTLPTTIGNLGLLTKLDLNSNNIDALPDTISNLLRLVILDLSGNQLTSLPATIGKLSSLEELDLSSNNLHQLPESIGLLSKLKKLIIEHNKLEEVPHTIGQCTSLKELRADYNKLRALPEAVGRIETLEVLSVRYNNIKQLPTTMSSLLHLRELDVSFNELESVPENLCFATSLVKINIGNNFADMQSLPRSIGNLENLEELDINYNQIRIFPESFRMLTNLRILRAQENPLEVPPRHVVENGAQAVVQFMADLVANKDVKGKAVKQNKAWGCFSIKSNKRKSDGTDDTTT